MNCWTTQTPLQFAFEKVFEVFGIKENTINDERLPKELNEEQVRALQELENMLHNVTKDEIRQLEPIDLFTETTSWGNVYEPCTLLYDYKGHLLCITTLLEEVDKRVQIDKFAPLITDVNQVMDIIEEVSEETAKEIFATKLKALADKKSLTQQAIASALQTSQQNVNIWFNKSKPGYPSISLLIQLACLLETSVDYLIRPDALAVNLDEDALFKSIGITADNSKKLKELIKSEKKDIITTLNLIIGNYGGTDSILHVLTEYFKMPFESSLSVVPFSELLDLQQSLQMADSVDDALSYAKGFLENYVDLDVQSFRKYQLDKIMLLDLIAILTRMRDNKVEQYY